MNFLQIAERVAEELNGTPLGFSSVDLGKDSSGNFIIADPVQRQAVRAVQLAFDWIMNFSNHWEFLNKRGVLWQLQAGVREYRKPQVESVEWDSLYVTKEGSIARWPIYQMEYDDWQRREQAEIPSSGYPLYLISAPQDRWIVWPTPTGDWALNGAAQLAKTRLESASDEPPWDEVWHELVVWRAVMQMESRERVQEDATQPLAASAAQRAFNSLWPAFLTKYGPGFRGARALS
jgi:hypothetical protein